MKCEQIGTCTLYNADCMELMAQYPDKHFDLAIVDPPYFKGPENTRYYGSEKSNTGVNRPQYRQMVTWDIPTNNYYNELCRVSMDQVIWGINYFNFKNVPCGRIVWDKKKNEACTFSDGEIASCSLINTVKFFRYQWDGMLQENMKNKELKIHPCQKPIALYKFLLSKYAKQGDKILDTHLGSGTHAIACNEMGFDLTASEIDADYFTAACERIREANRQGDLFRQAV